MVAGAVPDPVTDLCLIVAYILPLFPRLTSPTGPPPSPLTGACLAHPALRPLSRGPLAVLHAGVFRVFLGPLQRLAEAHPAGTAVCEDGVDKLSFRLPPKSPVVPQEKRSRR